MATLLTDNRFTVDDSLGWGLEYLYTTSTRSSWYYWLTYTVEGRDWWIPDVILELGGDFQLDGQYQPIGGTITKIWQWNLAYGSHYEITGISYDYNLFDAQVLAGDTAALRAALFTGNDVMRAAGLYNSDYPWHVSLYGLAGHDTLYGHSGQDSLYGGPGNDKLLGMDGADQLFGGGGNDTLNGGAQADLMRGSYGSDHYYADNTGDIVTELAGQGTDTVRASLSYTLPANVERLVLQGTAPITGTGNSQHNALTGNIAANRLYGVAGNDTLRGLGGYDTLSGGSGNDTLVGGPGGDKLTGGLGNDTFDFNRAGESPASGGRDHITDFAAGDRIDLSDIDADTLTPGNQAFSALTTGAAFPGVFSALGELYYDTTSQMLYGNNDADAQADFSFQVKLSGLVTLTTTDFVL